jgi:hypothetical protein
VQRIPATYTAKIFGFDMQKPYFKAAEGAQRVPQIDFSREESTSMPKFLPMVYLSCGSLWALFGALFTLGLAPRMDLSDGCSVVDLPGLLAFGLARHWLWGWEGCGYGIRRLTQARRAVQVERDASLTRTILHRVCAQPQGITPQKVS